jgi:hypothetical protein
MWAEGCARAVWDTNTPQEQGLDSLDDHHFSAAALSPDSLGFVTHRSSPVAIHPRNRKQNPIPIPTTDYPSLNASLMQAIEVFNGGKHMARRRKMLWVEASRGKGQKAGPSEDDVY